MLTVYNYHLLMQIAQRDVKLKNMFFMLRWIMSFYSYGFWD